MRTGAPSRVHAYGQLFAAAATSNPWSRWGDDETGEFAGEMPGKNAGEMVISLREDVEISWIH